MIWIFWLLLTTINDKSFLHKACITQDEVNYDVKMRQVKKQDAQYCVTMFNNCSNAELTILLDDNARQTFYVSQSKDYCK